MAKGQGIFGGSVFGGLGMDIPGVSNLSSLVDGGEGGSDGGAATIGQTLTEWTKTLPGGGCDHVPTAAEICDKASTCYNAAACSAASKLPIPDGGGGGGTLPFVTPTKNLQPAPSQESILTSPWLWVGVAVVAAGGLVLIARKKKS